MLNYEGFFRGFKGPSLTMIRESPQKRAAVQTQPSCRGNCGGVSPNPTVYYPAIPDYPMLPILPYATLCYSMLPHTTLYLLPSTEEPDCSSIRGAADRADPLRGPWRVLPGRCRGIFTASSSWLYCTASDGRALGFRVVTRV